MTLDDILNAAREKTGLPDPDTDTWREGLEILLRDQEKADILTERGRGIMASRYTSALATRMQVDDYIRRNPSVAEAPVKRPVFILGMPRTGTTMASYLLSSDPAARSLLKWEAYDGVPPAAPGALKTDPRCLAEVARDDVLLKANPGMFVYHFEAADGPTEDVHLVAQDFKTLMYTAMTTLPTYSEWILFCDMRPAFAHRKRVFQILQSTNPGRWVLKMPSDSLFIRTIFETFPDARVIWTHRDPYATFASSMSMRGNTRLIFNKEMDLPYMQSRFPLQLALHLARPLEVSRERPDAVYHLYYDDMMADPIGQMMKVYAWLGDPWTDAAEAGMRGWLEQNPQDRFGRHSYTLEKWGFTKKDLEPYFHDYLKAHPVATAKEA